MNKPLPTKMDIDDDDLEEEEEIDLIKKEESKKGDLQEENVCDEDMEPVNSSRISQISHKKNLKDEARKLWLAVEVGDRLAALKIL